MRIRRCRVCYNSKLIKIGSLGRIAISDFTKYPSEGTRTPLELVYCKKCTLLQLAHNTPRDLLYKSYWYQSHLNPIIVKDLKEIGKLCEGAHADIGSNDGTLLRYSKADYKIAIDPSNIIPDGFKRVKKYWEDVERIGLFNTITAIAVIYDLLDPNKFIKNVTNHLTSNGVFISQLMTLQPMIENNDVGNICHEHLEYFSYKSLVKLFEQNGLEIFKVEKNNINGGSYRIFARHYQKGSIKFKEKEYGIKELKDFFKRIEGNKKKFWELNKTAHMSIYGYGASTKANTILQYYDVDCCMSIVDINPKKVGKYTVGSMLPIIDKIPKDCEYLWVFPYGFLDYFRKKEKGYKGKWITTIPKFQIS